MNKNDWVAITEMLCVIGMGLAAFCAVVAGYEMASMDRYSKVTHAAIVSSVIAFITVFACVCIALSRFDALSKNEGKQTGREVKTRDGDEPN